MHSSLESEEMDSTTVEKQLAAVVRDEVLQSTLMAFRAMYDLSGNVSEVSTVTIIRPDHLHLQGLLTWSEGSP